MPHPISTSVLSLTAIAGGLLLATPTLAAPFHLDGEPRIAFIYAATARDGGWNEAIDNARQKVADELGYPIAVAESIPEDASALKNAIDLYVQRGFNIIVGTTYGYSDGIAEAAEKYPNVAFMNASGTTHANNLESFYARTYEGWYLAGIAAGAVADDGKLGMLAGFPVSVVDWDINGFTRGVQVTNPEATVSVLYTNSWWDPVKEGQATQSLLEQGASVIANNLSSAAPFSEAEKADAYSVGFQLDMSAQAPDKHLTSVVFHWDKYLIPTIESIVAGTWEPEPNGAFPGLADGVVDITPLPDSVPDAVKQTVAAKRAAIIAGELTPFDGPLIAQDGTEKLPRGEAPTDAQLWAMDYLVQGTLGGGR
ncbi:MULTISPECIES: BMP family ABC transporter substrate-binding protein [unclassified Modicisalibacter]|uniref:BMP family ABC transporter substrate-binding protein n=1 Tax=unclassified Modicisalibacter TaxID=2679913 RepID=UPI001CCDC126|nr:MULTISPECIES: BMP family ABC transporter substrate-binding protein [unclassified Modicisalibacter]MBZ9556461.1 BMP family ABC transporter substrate-binding protein [Modicisalibacter sp. R2A 31.J]MBZ9575070.1 BMP family ABC transporter substrate-binding protein [Modicisalibacter sp. MOD 31.J]